MNEMIAHLIKHPVSFVQIQSGKGYDLNVCLFEDLIQQGMRFRALNRQHRMQPAISKPVRELTYPNLRMHIVFSAVSPCWALVLQVAS